MKPNARESSAKWSLSALQKEAYEKLRSFVLHSDQFPKAAVIHGPPGCGKSALCRRFAQDHDYDVRVLGFKQLADDDSGVVESTIMHIFRTCMAHGSKRTAIVIDEIDIWAPNRVKSAWTLRLIGALSDALEELREDKSRSVLLLTTCCALSDVHRLLVRRGKLGCTVGLSALSFDDRTELCRQWMLRMWGGGTDVEGRRNEAINMASVTPGFMLADMMSLLWRLEDGITRDGSNIEGEETTSGSGETKDKLTSREEFRKTVSAQTGRRRGVTWTGDSSEISQGLLTVSFRRQQRAGARGSAAKRARAARDRDVPRRADPRAQRLREDSAAEASVRHDDSGQRERADASRVLAGAHAGALPAGAGKRGQPRAEPARRGGGVVVEQRRRVQPAAEHAAGGAGRRGERAAARAAAGDRHHARRAAGGRRAAARRAAGRAHRRAAAGRRGAARHLPRRVRAARRGADGRAAAAGGERRRAVGRARAAPGRGAASSKRAARARARGRRQRRGSCAVETRGGCIGRCESTRRCARRGNVARVRGRRALSSACVRRAAAAINAQPQLVRNRRELLACLPAVLLSSAAPDSRPVAVGLPRSRSSSR
ncbi:ATPase AAA-type [Gracilaria domingensis]|nr:ATPase AAA-type [Gracilaria domingensis]